jgi:hypothetical protein
MAWLGLEQLVPPEWLFGGGAEEGEGDAVVEVEGLDGLVGQFWVEDEGVGEEDGLVGGHPRPRVEQDAVVLPHEPLEEVLVLGGLSARSGVEHAFEGGLARQVAHDAEDVAALPLVLVQHLLALLRLALEQQADLQPAHAQQEVAHLDLQGEGALGKLRMLVIIEDGLGSGPFDLPPRPPLPELAVRVLLLPPGRGEPHSHQSLVVEEVASEVAGVGG